MISSGLMLNGAVPLVNPPLPGSGAPPDTQDYYLRENADGSFHALLTTANVANPGPGLDPMEIDATPDLNHIIVQSPAALTEGAVENELLNIYEWSAGQFYPINVPPGLTGNQTSPGGRLGSGLIAGHLISADGSRVVWSSPEHDHLYLREGIGTPTEHTVTIFGTGNSPSGKTTFRDASSADTIP